MLKRIFGLVLCIVMLASVVPFGTFASYHDHIAVSGSSQTIDGVTYTVVTTESALRSAVSAGGNIILGNDIALSSATQLSIAPGTLLDGNGYAITYSGVLSDALIVFQTGNITGTYGGVGTVTLRNLHLGTSAVKMRISGTSGLAKETTTTNSNAQIHVVWQNVEFYVNNSGATAANGGVLSTAYGTHEFSGCTLTANIVSTTSLVGGWIGTMSNAQIYMKDCVTKGSVQGVGGVGGFIGEANTESATFENCVNMATITATANYCGGLVGNIGAGIHSIYFVNCKNYGIVRSQGTGYNSMAGGIVGRMSNTKTYDAGVNGFYGCINYGKISDGNSAGGILGRNHDGDSANPQYFQFKDCLNVGEVVGDAHAGGMAGALTPTLTSATMINCANVGKITSASGKAGNFAGVLSGATLTNCYAAGYITAATAGVLAGQISGTYTAQDGSSKTYVAPKLTNVRYLSNLASSVAQDATLASGADLTDMLADMDAAYGLHFATTKSPADFGSYVMAFVPVMRGWQQSTNSTTGKTDVRVAAVVNTLVDHASVGFKAVVRSNGKSVKVEQDVTEVYTELSATSENGTLAKITAKSLSAKYIYAFVLTGVPLASDAAIEVTPYAVDAQGVKHYGKTTVLVCSNGQYHEESILLNGVPLEQFSVVYPSASSNNEKLIAERLAAKIGELTGHTVSCYSDATATRSNEILVGKTNRYTVSVSGRWIYRPEETKTSIILTGSTMSAISETVQYFLNALEEKRANGQGAWAITSSISVPVDDQVSIMAYNTGAKDDSTIKKAEWDLIVDYLPDIFTMQEPWAGWLDDFLNNYAVKPSTSFVASSSDDDVMSTTVNNKAFTGNGYYGVYWGLPRWKPADSGSTVNKGGKASYSVILYAKDRFTVDTSKSGTFWLSATPGTSGSAYSDSSHARCATYATLTDKNTNESFVVVNVHLDYASVAVQQKQVAVLLQQLKNKVGTSIPIFVTGDMNARRASGALDQFYTDGWTALDSMADVSYHYDSTIDWLYTNSTTKVTAQFYKYCNERTYYTKAWVEAEYPHLSMPSDHPAVYAEVKINTGATRPSASTETAPSTSHNFGDWIPSDNTADTHYRECECGETEIKNCTFVWTKVLIPATHGEEGLDLYSCSVCERTKTVVTEPTDGHEFGDWTPDTTVSDGHYRDCPCGEHETGTCEWEQTEVTKAPTYMEEGEAIYTCSLCGRTETRVLDKIPMIDTSPAGGDGKLHFFDDRNDMGDFILIR